MQPEACPLLPSSSLPPLRSIDSLTEDRIFAALQDLLRIYCPLSTHLTQRSAATGGRKRAEDDLVADSGYVSAADDGGERDAAFANLRADVYERAFAERWLTGFLARAEELACITSDEMRQRAVDQTSQILESFSSMAAADEDVRRGELADYSRDFSFEAPHASGEGEVSIIQVRLNDGLAGQDSEEADDVGLQSWGASIVFSHLICGEPARFGLSRDRLGAAGRIVDLGAGTGLVSLVLGKLLPQVGLRGATVVATDYHPAVLDNLRANVGANFDPDEGEGEGSVQVALLDWAAPSREPPLDAPADVLFATDVVYAEQHAVWLRDCATGLLAPGGVFWLLATVRQTGRFDGVSNTVGVAFGADDRPRGPGGKRLTILDETRLEKRSGVGRGDEAGYRLFRIGWQ